MANVSLTGNISINVEVELERYHFEQMRLIESLLRKTVIILAHRFVSLLLKYVFRNMHLHKAGNRQAYKSKKEKEKIALHFHVITGGVQK